MLHGGGSGEPRQTVRYCSGSTIELRSPSACILVAKIGFDRLADGKEKGRSRAFCYSTLFQFFSFLFSAMYLGPVMLGSVHQAFHQDRQGMGGYGGLPVGSGGLELEGCRPALLPV